MSTLPGPPQPKRVPTQPPVAAPVENANQQMKHDDWPEPSGLHTVYTPPENNYMPERNFESYEEEATRQMRVQSILVYGGVGGAGTSTLVAQLNQNGIKAFEPKCRCQLTDIFNNSIGDLPKTRIVVVPATTHGAEAATKFTSKFPTQIIVAIRTTPLSIPWAARVKFRAISGRSEIFVLPFVWNFKKNQLDRPHKKYQEKLNQLVRRLHNQMGTSPTDIRLP